MSHMKSARRGRSDPPPEFLTLPRASAGSPTAGASSAHEVFRPRVVPETIPRALDATTPAELTVDPIGFDETSDPLLAFNLELEQELHTELAAILAADAPANDAAPIPTDTPAAGSADVASTAAVPRVTARAALHTVRRRAAAYLAVWLVLRVFEERARSGAGAARTLCRRIVNAVLNGAPRRYNVRVVCAFVCGVAVGCAAVLATVRLHRAQAVAAPASVEAVPSRASRPLPVDADLAPRPAADTAGAVSETPPAEPAKAVAPAQHPRPTSANLQEPSEKAERPAAAHAVYKGTLVVSSSPGGARVSINGVPAGATPLVLRDLPAGSKVVRVELDGFEPWSAAVRVVADEQTFTTAKLLPRH
jgi:hypothetical protein